MDLVGFYLCIVSVTLPSLHLTYSETSVITQRVLPVPLRTYKGPQSIVYGRLTVPKYTESVKFHIFVGVPSSCQIPPTLWAIAHDRYPYVDFRNSSKPDQVYVAPNNVDMLLNATQSERMVVIQSPSFGDWFWGALVNRSYKEEIKQTGLNHKKSCHPKAMIHQMSAISDEPPLVSADGTDFELSINQTSFVLRRFQPQPGVFSVRLQLLKCSNENSSYAVDACPVEAKFSINSLPFVPRGKSVDVPYASTGLNVTWNPLRVDSLNFFRLSSLLKVGKLSLKLRLIPEQTCALAQHLANVVPPRPEGCILMPEMNRFIDFMVRFQYYFSYNIESSAWSRMTISSNRYVTAFRIRNGEDQGGTLRVAVRADPMLLDAVSEAEVRVYACLARALTTGHDDDDCIFRLFGSSMSWNSKSDVFIPYPSVGLYYVTIWRKCYSADKPISCSNSSTVSLHVSAQPCVNGSCGKFGSCSLVSSRDIQFGACQCRWGFAGLDCSDGRFAVPRERELLNLLLLTLSNVFFIPAIVMALRRRFYVQALVYCYIMFSSTFYHLCDSSTPYSTCILNYHVLAFCDFYGAIMAIWVTLIAMANLPRGVAELAYVAAALGLVIGVVSNRHSLYAFLIPLLVGLALVLISWTRQCCIRRKCYPKRKWWLAGCMPGIILSACGLILFAFFETAANYGYVHSLWHVLISLSIVFLLPWSRAPPLCQRGGFLSFTAMRNRAAQLDGDESPLDDGERVSMATGINGIGESRAVIERDLIA